MCHQSALASSRESRRPAPAMQAIPARRKGLGLPCVATMMPVGTTVSTNTHSGSRNMSPISDGG